MPWRNGIYQRLQSWRARAAAGAPISPVEFDADGDDEAAALSLALLRDGTSVPTADLPMGNHGLTGMRQAAAPGEPVEFAQAQALIAAGAGTAINLIQNASFRVNQRGVSGTVTLAANAYGHDRWKAGAAGCTYTFAQVGADTQITITAGSLVQIVAAVEVDAGSFTLQNAGTAQGRIYQGTPGGFSATPVTGTLAAGTAVTVEFGTGTILQPQIVAGSAAKPFSRPPLAADYLQCQRYYEVTPIFSGGYTGNNVSFNIPWKVNKAAVPTVTAVLNTSLSFGISSISSDLITTVGSRGYGNYSGTSPGIYQLVGSFTASCEP